MVSFVVYALLDPKTGLCRYVGKGKDARDRVSAHCAEARKTGRRTHKANWIKSLLDCGLYPSLVFLETNLTEDEAFEAECFYISYFRFLGLSLTNATDGGEGNAGRAGTPHHTVPVLAASLDSGVIKFASIAEAARSLGTSVGNIQRAIQKGTRCKGLFWRRAWN